MWHVLIRIALLSTKQKRTHSRAPWPDRTAHIGAMRNPKAMGVGAALARSASTAGQTWTPPFTRFSPSALQTKRQIVLNEHVVCATTMHHEEHAIPTLKESISVTLITQKGLCLPGFQPALI